MDVPMSWLKDFVDLDCTIKEYTDAITLSGSKVETVKEFGKDITNVVSGKITHLEKHPDADKLQICTVDVGGFEPVTIVTGASNVFEGAYVPVALPGATLANGVVIEKGVLRGVASDGMLCSVEELGCDRHDYPEAPEHGIYIFPEAVELGKDVTDLMDMKDEAVEFEITSNRPDCFSVAGIARETAATFKKPFALPEIKLEEKAGGNAADMISVEIQNPEYCYRYVARIIKNVKIEPSPRWMRKRLRSAGIRPINNIVDITNYVMVELGQPMHAFDIDEIDERKIIVRNAKDGEKFVTLDGIERELDSEMTMIADINKSVGIGGVMGGENSKISENASGVLLESACFNGPNIRVTAKKLGLRTDASSKFEKGLDPNMSLYAANRACQLVEQLGAGEVVAGYVDCYPAVRNEWELSYSPEWINKLLGTNVSEDEMIEIFDRLEIKTDKAAKKVTIPTFRPDLEAQADLAEEVARFYGYDKIEPTLAAGTPTVGRKTYPQIIRDIIKNTMIYSGLCEAMNFTFESPKVFKKLNISENSHFRKTVEIANPLGEDFSIMRTTTLNGMLTSLANNYNRKNDSAALFEIGKVYLPKSLPLMELPEEKELLTIGMYGKVDFFDLKGIIEELFEKLGMTEKVSYEPRKDLPFMHPGRTADLRTDGKSFGYIGEIHPLVAENYGIGTRVYAAVVDVKTLIDNAQLVRTFKALPKFPAVEKDISMVVKKSIPVKKIEEIIVANGGQYLESAELFDVYTGNQIEEGYKSVSFALVFRAEDKTLKFADISKDVDNILEKLNTELGVNLRDK
ncbi:MAG: phenylalanine--tRNA ligase subunit beta [Firmicutes bacterium]|nr:phenylalanine--tRNA ligase subunit beta [Bacillota bacterium]